MLMKFIPICFHSFHVKVQIEIFQSTILAQVCNINNLFTFDISSCTAVCGHTTVPAVSLPAAAEPCLFARLSNW